MLGGAGEPLQGYIQKGAAAGERPACAERPGSAPLAPPGEGGSQRRGEGVDASEVDASDKPPPRPGGHNARGDEVDAAQPLRSFSGLDEISAQRPDEEERSLLRAVARAAQDRTKAQQRIRNAHALAPNTGKHLRHEEGLG